MTPSLYLLPYYTLLFELMTLFWTIVETPKLSISPSAILPLILFFNVLDEVALTLTFILSHSQLYTERAFFNAHDFTSCRQLGYKKGAAIVLLSVSTSLIYNNGPTLLLCTSASLKSILLCYVGYKSV